MQLDFCLLKSMKNIEFVTGKLKIMFLQIFEIGVHFAVIFHIH